MVASEIQEVGDWNTFRNDIKNELDQVQRELKEIELMIEHSQIEVSKLSQRNAAITTHLQQVQNQFDSLPRADIRQAYDAALDGQQRLFVMRGQLEKLQSDHTLLERYASTLTRVVQLLEGAKPSEAGAQAPKATVETVEMMIQSQESERQRLSRQMHDGPAQALSNFILQTEIAMRLFDVDQARARAELENLKAAATNTFQKVRDFIFDLRPMMLDDLGLIPTLKRYVEAFKEQNGIEVQLSLAGVERRLENYLEVMVFRAIQELLGFAVYENRASQIQVQVDIGEKNVKVSVEDNGKGFEVESLSERNHMGISLIKDRVELLGGYLDVSSIIGQGSRITFQIPVAVVSSIA